MSKYVLNRFARVAIAAVLVVVMWIFQYYPELVDFKFWIGFVVVLCILVYMVSMVVTLAKKVSDLEKRETERLKADAERLASSTEKAEE